MRSRLIVAIILLMLLAGCGGKSPAPAPAKPDAEASPESLYDPSGILKADAAKLKSTVVTATLDEPIVAGKNVLWCSTFQLAWNEMCDLLGGDIRLEGGSPLADSLNKHTATKADLDDASYVAMAGCAGEGFWDKVRAALKEKFPNETFELVDPPVAQDLAAYAALVKNIEFPMAFESLDESVRLFAGRPTRFFGIGKNSTRSMELQEQVEVLDVRYLDREGQSTEVVVELKTKSPDDRLILAMLPPGATLGDTVAEVLRRMAPKTRPLTNREKMMVEYDELAVPKLNVDLLRAYGELEGKHAIGGPPIVFAMQKVLFRLDERGVRLKSEASCIFGEMPKLIFDHPFLILMERRGAKAPYFALWVDNPELLVPETPERLALLKKLPFDEVRPFSEGLAAVRVGNQWGYIDATGKRVVAPQFDWAGDFHEGRARVATAFTPEPEPEPTAKPETKSERVATPPAKPLPDWLKPRPGEPMMTEADDVFYVRDGQVARHDDPEDSATESEPGETARVREKVERRLRWGFIDRDGKTVVPIRFDFVLDFCEGLAAVCMDGQPMTLEAAQYGLAEKSGDVVAGIGGLVAVGGKWGYVDASGNVIVPLQYSEARSFRNGIALVVSGFAGKHSDSKRWHAFIDQSGRNVFGKEFTWAEEFSDGLAAVEIDGNPNEPGLTLSYIDRTGMVVIAEGGDDFVDGVARANRDKKEGFIDKTGTFYPIEVDADTVVFSPTEGRLSVRKNDKTGFVDTHGKLVIPMIYGSAYYFSEGLAWVIFDGAVGYIDTNGKMVIPPQFMGAEDFHEGFAAAKNTEDYWGLIDRTGRYVVPPAYERIANVTGGLAQVRLNGKVGLIDTTGKVIVEPRFTVAQNFREGFAAVAIQTGGGNDSPPIYRWGFVDKTGNLLEIHP